MYTGDSQVMKASNDKEHPVNLFMWTTPLEYLRLRERGDPLSLAMPIPEPAGLPEDYRSNWFYAIMP